MPVEFDLFALMLLGIALFHKRSLEISIVGLLLIVAYEALFRVFPTGAGASALLQPAPRR